MADFEQDKRELRQRLLAQRRLMPEAAAAEASREICRRVNALLAERLPACFRDKGAVFSYLAYGREVDLAGVHQQLWRQGRPLAVPRTQGLPRGIMQAVYLTAAEAAALQPTARGIAEPGLAAAECLPENVAAVLLPGVAFDPQGGRLGQGGGYYDRFLLRLPPEVLLIGVSYDWQLVAAVPQAEWDRPVGLVVTEQRQIECRI